MSPQSKTKKPCTCHWLQRAADEPDMPVEFDPSVNEYHFIYDINGAKGALILYHCPFCGGAAPESKRATLFTHPTSKEIARLQKLTETLKTVDEVFAAFGPPDADHAHGIGYGHPERDDRPPVYGSYRLCVYESLSETARVHVTVFPDNRVGFTYVGKYIGPPVDTP